MKIQIKYELKLRWPFYRVPKEKTIEVEGKVTRYIWHSGWECWVPVDKNGKIPEDYHGAGSDY